MFCSSTCSSSGVGFLLPCCLAIHHQNEDSVVHCSLQHHCPGWQAPRGREEFDRRNISVSLMVHGGGLSHSCAGSLWCCLQWPLLEGVAAQSLGTISRHGDRIKPPRSPPHRGARALAKSKRRAGQPPSALGYGTGSCGAMTTVRGLLKIQSR